MPVTNKQYSGLGRVKTSPPKGFEGYGGGGGGSIGTETGKQ